MRISTKLAVFTIGALLALASTEALVRVLGLADSPLYDKNTTVGYLARPNQTGRFLRNRWYINERSMIDARKFDPSARPVLVVGDSVVFGGNPFDQSERVASLVQAVSPRPVYPVAAGGWSLANELAYFRDNPDVPAAASRIIFVTNEDDFVDANYWECESYNPTHRPALHTYWALRKYLAPDCTKGGTPMSLRPPHTDLAAEMRSFMEKYGDRVRFVLYPRRDRITHDFSDKLLALSPLITEDHILRLTAPQVQARFGWQPSYYHDHVHPNLAGNRALAAVVSTLLPPSDPLEHP